VYNAWRLVLFAGCGALLALAGLRSIALLAAALLTSGVLSYFLLDGPRRALAEAVGEAVDRGRQRMADRTAREDAYVDEMQARGGEVTQLDR
jgi:TRAP-type C4-dicarboxylate transport system substrate-binding protein